MIDVNVLSKAAWTAFTNLTEKPKLNTVSEYTNNIFDAAIDEIEIAKQSKQDMDYATFKQSTVMILKMILSICYINNIDLNNYLQIIVNNDENVE